MVISVVFRALQLVDEAREEGAEVAVQQVGPVALFGVVLAQVQRYLPGPRCHGRGGESAVPARGQSAVSEDLVKDTAEHGTNGKGR